VSFHTMPPTWRRDFIADFVFMLGVFSQAGRM
jgi:hypothetical protein